MLVISDTGESLGVLDKETALRIAGEKELDLVLINPQAEPPVAKIISWSKFKYEQTKKHKSNKGKAGDLKEMWFPPTIEQGDLEHKIARVKEFITKGHKVKLTVRIKRKRGVRFTREQIKSVMDKVLAELGDMVVLDGEPKYEGANLAVFVRKK
jgi:translation initiation factor IF-3